VPEQRIIEIIRHVVKYAPTAFNSQSARVVVLFSEESDKLWGIVKETLREKVAPEKFARTEAKVDAFSSGYGTALFFEDQIVVAGLQELFPKYKEAFRVWSLQANGMLEYVVWTALEAEGLGANIQHYNPLIDEKVKKQWGLPESWELLCQMPFGKPTAPAGEKTFLPLDARVKVFGL
jgi:predicted oxidoreductase (fatty acid repression mutant protein)